MNKNGVKLLAAVMVFAMAFAGIFVAIGGEESDAEGGATITGTVANGEKSISFDEALKGVKDGETITATSDIKISGGVLPIDKSITINMVGYNLTIAVDGSIAIAKEKIVTITNASTSDNNLIDVVGSNERVLAAISVGEGSTLNLTDTANKYSVIESQVAPSTIDLASKAILNYNGLAGVQSMNYVAASGAVINADSISDKATITGYFDLTGATVNAKNIGIYAATLKEGSKIDATQVGVYNGIKIPSEINKNYTYAINTVELVDKDSSVTADKIVYGLDGKANGSNNLKFIGAGSVTGDIELKKDQGSLYLKGVTYSGVVSNVDEKTHSATISNIVAPNTEDGLTFTAGSIEIDGIPQEATNGRIVVSNGDAKITGTIPAGVTLVIEENATVTEDSKIVIADKATMEVYGTVAPSTEGNGITNNGKLVITPTSNYSAKTEGTGSIVQDAEMSKPFYIGGELEKSMELGNATLNDNLHIPEGKVLTVDGDLFLNDYNIVVDGELVITKNGCIYEIGGKDGAIVISKGTISNNGIIGNAQPVTVAYDDPSSEDPVANIVSMQGVAGVNFTVKKIGENNAVIVSGEITRISAVEKNEITIHAGAVIGDLTIAKKVKLIVDDVKTADNSTITINGAIASSASTKTISLGFASTFVMNGSSDGNVTISAATGLLKDNTTFEDAAKKDVTVKPGNNVTGFTIYTKKVAVADGSTTKYYMRAYINGTFDKIGTPNHNDSDNIPNTSEDVTITGEFYVAADETITVSKDASITAGTEFKANISGSIVIADKDLDDKYFQNKYVGASYAITTGTAPNTATTLYYTTFSAAIAVIGDVDEKAIESTVDKVEADFTVKADESVAFVGATVASKATVTVETDGSVTGIKVVEGMVVVKDGATCTIPTAGYAAKSVSADNTITYAGLKVAIENAAEGDVIVISSGETKESLTIPAGVTVTVNNDLKVGGDLTVSEGASLIIKGSLTMTSSKAVTTQVIGTLDVSAGTYVQGTHADSTLKSTGMSIFKSIADLKFSGAYYTDANSNYAITTVAKAVNGAFAAAQDKINVKGTVNESGEITLKDVTLILDQKANVKLGTVTLDKAKIDASAAGAKITATVVGMNGDGDKAVSSSVKTSESQIVIEQTSSVKADDSISNKFTVSGVDGTVTIASGNVNFAADVTIENDPKNKLVVADGATLTLDKNLTIDTKVSFIVDGTVVVSGKTLDLNSKKAEINGTVEVTKAGTVSLTNAVINGTIDVKVEKDKNNQLTIAVDGFKFGKAATSIGADAKIIGKVVFDTGVKYIIAYPGIDLSQAVINPDPVTGEITAVSTTYSINGVQYATVYAVEDLVAINNAITLAMIKDIKGLNFSEYTAATNPTPFVWYNEDGTEATGYVGDVSSVTVDVPVSEQKVTVSVGTGISLYIDGVKYNSGSEPSLTVGEHKVTATVNPGYKGTVDIMVNGVKITNGVFTVALGVNTVVSATGNITIDSGETPVTPVQPTEKDDGMGITDYLLIVLVVLAAILVVIVAIRMMRS